MLSTKTTRYLVIKLRKTSNKSNRQQQLQRGVCQVHLNKVAFYKKTFNYLSIKLLKDLKNPQRHQVHTDRLKITDAISSKIHKFNVI